MSCHIEPMGVALCLPDGMWCFISRHPRDTLSETIGQLPQPNRWDSGVQPFSYSRVNCIMLPQVGKRCHPVKMDAASSSIFHTEKTKPQLHNLIIYLAFVRGELVPHFNRRREGCWVPSGSASRHCFDITNVQELSLLATIDWPN